MAWGSFFHLSQSDEPSSPMVEMPQRAAPTAVAPMSRRKRRAMFMAAFGGSEDQTTGQNKQEEEEEPVILEALEMEGDRFQVGVGRRRPPPLDKPEKPEGGLGLSEHEDHSSKEHLQRIEEDDWKVAAAEAESQPEPPKEDERSEASGSPEQSLESHKQRPDPPPHRAGAGVWAHAESAPSTLQPPGDPPESARAPVEKRESARAPVEKRESFRGERPPTPLEKRESLKALFAPMPVIKVSPPSPPRASQEAPPREPPPVVEQLPALPEEQDFPRIPRFTRHAGPTKDGWEIYESPDFFVPVDGIPEQPRRLQAPVWPSFSPPCAKPAFWSENGSSTRGGLSKSLSESSFEGRRRSSGLPASSPTSSEQLGKAKFLSLSSVASVGSERAGSQTQTVSRLEASIRECEAKVELLETSVKDLDRSSSKPTVKPTVVLHLPAHAVQPRTHTPELTQDKGKDAAALALANQLRKRCLALSKELHELAADALDAACNRVPGAMDIFEATSATIERVAVCLERCASCLNGVNEEPGSSRPAPALPPPVASQSSADGLS